MDREQRKQLHTKAGTSPLTTQRPTAQNMVNGEERDIIINGILRHYRKEQGQLYYLEYTKE